MIEHADKIRRELAQLRRLIEAHGRGKRGFYRVRLVATVGQRAEK